jgi:hypothetical protein
MGQPLYADGKKRQHSGRFLHVLVSDASELDAELMSWIAEAYAF